jgi:molybdopterin converting factor small subunit
MSQKIVIPTPLRKYTGGAEVIEIEGPKNVQEVIDQLEIRCPGIRAGVCDSSGTLRRFINIYVDGEDVRFLEDLRTPVRDSSEVTIIPAIAGG